MRLLALYPAFLLLACGSAHTPPTPAAHPLAWLEGTWQDDEGTGEHWFHAADDDVLMGQGFLVRALMEDEHDENPRAVEQTTETMEIIHRADAYVYVASPEGQTRTEFVITTLEANHFIAENPTHDFPTRIEYTLEGETLTAHVSSSERQFSLVLVRRDEAR